MTLIHLDTKKRVSLGKLLQGRDVNTFEVQSMPNGDIVLKPMAVVPEHWIFKNPAAFASLQRGIDHAAAGEARSYSAVKSDWSAKEKAKKRK
jgi:hypothetical protein